MSELRRADCRGGWYGTDESAVPHSPHGYFPHQWAEPLDCPGWTEQECDATALVDVLFRTDRGLPGLALECHPVVEYAMLRVIIPGYREFTDPSWMSPGFPLQTVGGIPVCRTVAADRGAWKLVSGREMLAEGIVRDR